VVFPTIEFAAFFIVVLALNWLLMPHRHAWKLFILTASVFFYGLADWRFVLLLAAVTVGNQRAAIGVGRSVGQRRRAWMLGAVVAVLGLLGWF
jgi:alginate O-acetyltransferase complex protein AlgI